MSVSYARDSFKSHVASSEHGLAIIAIAVAGARHHHHRVPLPMEQEITTSQSIFKITRFSFQLFTMSAWANCAHIFQQKWIVSLF
jgi:hypothetical protein